MDLVVLWLKDLDNTTIKKNVQQKSQYHANNINCGFKKCRTSAMAQGISA